MSDTGPGLMQPDELEGLTNAYLRYLEHARVPVDAADTEVSFAELMTRADANPHEEAWENLDELISGDADDAWKVVKAIVDRCHDQDLAMVGAGVLAALLRRKAAHLAGRFENEIRASDRFVRAFQFTVMTGVPLPLQQRLNAALLERGVDPKLVSEYDEEADE